MEKKICLLDTDIGDDIDDAFALALLLENPEIDLKAVTTVYKNTKFIFTWRSRTRILRL